MKRLKQLRKLRNLTQLDVAEALNIERATYAQYELGKRNPNNDMLLKLANYYQVSVDYLLENPISYYVAEETNPYNSKDETVEAIGEGVEIHFKDASKKLTPEQIRIFKAFYRSITEDEEEGD